MLAGADGCDARALVARWRLDASRTLTIALNLGEHAARLPAMPSGRIVFETPPRARDQLVDCLLPIHTCIAWCDSNDPADALRPPRSGNRNRSEPR